MLQNVNNKEINPRLIYTSSIIIVIKYSGHGTALAKSSYTYVCMHAFMRVYIYAYGHVHTC